MLRYVSNQQGKLALDIGAGHGYITSFLNSQGVDAVALDINPRNLRELSVKSSFIMADASVLPIRNDSLDIVIAFELVEHLENPAKALGEFRRTLKNGGVCLITTPTPSSSVANMRGHISVKPRHMWVQKLNGIGFDVRVVTYRYPVSLSSKFFGEKVSSMLSRLLGFMLGLYKRRIDVTSTKIVCTKKVARHECD